MATLTQDDALADFERRSIELNEIRLRSCEGPNPDERGCGTAG